MSADKNKDLEKYQKKSLKQIRKAILELVIRRNARVQGTGETMIRNRNQEQKITLENIRQM